jgi:hypothetical protein
MVFTLAKPFWGQAKCKIAEPKNFEVEIGDRIR